MYNENVYTEVLLVDALYRFIINLILFINAVLQDFYQNKSQFKTVFYVNLNVLFILLYITFLNNNFLNFC